MDDTTTPTPPEVTAAATVPAALPPDGLALLGTFGNPDTPTALLRLPDGKIASAKPGDLIGETVIASIADGAMILAHRNGQTQRLTIPTG